MLPNKVVQERMNVMGNEVCFQRAGNGTALVLVHGLLGYSFSWRFAIPLLAGSYEIFAPDMPGSGFSDCKVADCRLRAAAGRLLAFLDAVGVASCDLVGSSYGGATAILATTIAPARIRSLTLVSPANPWSTNGRKRVTLLGNPAVAAVFPSLARPFRWLHSYFHRRMYGDSRRVAPDTIAGYRKALAQPGVLEHAVKIVQSWREDMQELEAALPKIANTPSLVIWGGGDRVVAPASAEPLSSYFKNVRTVMMEGVGHLPYEECPEEFSRILLDFLRQSSSGSAFR